MVSGIPALLSGRLRQACVADPTTCIKFILDRGVPDPMSAQHFAALAENIHAGASQVHAVSMSVVASTRVSIRMSLMTSVRFIGYIAPWCTTMQCEGSWARLYQRCLKQT